jgi:N-glycosylase/DNA lyase
LRQDPWECLASFILSSTKQIVQIRQIVDQLCVRFGDPVRVPAGAAPMNAFPSASALACLSEKALRECKAGFRAPYLLETAKSVAARKPDLDLLADRPVDEARAALMELPGVGRKIADCALLFSHGFDGVFPVDTWILRALRDLYFPGKQPSLDDLRRFADSHFGPEAGYAQQFLFHYMRTKR